MKTMKTPLKLGLFLLTLTSYTFALNCQNAETSYEMKMCEQKALELADKELNLVYKQLMAQLDDTGKNKLRDAQRKWIQFRDAHAVFEADSMRGGTGEGLLYTATLKTLTQDRVKALKAALYLYQ